MKQNLFIITAVIVISGAFMPVHAIPNPLEYPSAGGILMPERGGENIVLESAIVVVDLSSDIAHVKMTCELRNSSGNPVRLLLGLPEALPTSGKQPAIEKVSITVDGEKQEFKNKGILNAPFESPNSLYGWEMKFEPGQMRTVTAEYDCSTVIILRDSGDKYGNRTLKFLIQPGTGWSGNIGKMEISVNLKDDSARQIRVLTPKHASWKGDTVVWKLKDFEPDNEYNINVVFGPDGYKHVNLKPGIDSVLTALMDKTFKEHDSVLWLASGIGTKECIEILKTLNHSGGNAQKLRGME